MWKVFLVEDESLIREGLRDNIPWEQFGFMFVGEASDGEMALPLIRKTKPDVLITDIKMPFMDGLSLSKIVHNEFPNMKIVIISGYDDFEYARTAIEVGVEQYLLKPITRAMLRKTLLELKEKMEQDEELNDYQVQFENEMHEYEKFSRRRFFERLLNGEMSVSEIYEEAGKQSLDLTASCYKLLIFGLREKKNHPSQVDMEEFIRRQDEIMHFFLRHPQYILFSQNANVYGVLILGDEKQVTEYSQKAIDTLKRVCGDFEKGMSWHVAMGEPIERLSMLSESYQMVNHYFAYRFIMPHMHIMTPETMENVVNIQADKSIDSVDPSGMDPLVIRDFLSKGNRNEIYDFVDSYLSGIKEALKSKMFRDYVTLNIRFTVTAYIENLGISKDEFWTNLEQSVQEMHLEPEEISDYFATILQEALRLRDEDSDNQSKKILRKALEYIDEEFDKESISLNSVANAIDVSPNYFSSIFSQSMQITFVEYVTNKRMDKAKRMLKSTDLSLTEVAMAVGYKDPHYFSFVFKKTQGMSPREYRLGKKS